ncbi:MAG: aspartate kinase [Bacteroidales bacterium]|nr:aspartate kinase [Bacteroidales bacterium]
MSLFLYICGMYINVFKFGGLAVDSAAGIKNVAGILKRFHADPLLVVVSAMGKTTNALEELFFNYRNNDPLAVVESYQKIWDFHFSILEDLFQDKTHIVFGEVDSLFNQLRGYIRKGHLYDTANYEYDYEYDQVVSYGELISTVILHHYLLSVGFHSNLFDVRELIRTDSTYRDAHIDWKTTRGLIRNKIQGYFQDYRETGTIALTQGFIASDAQGNTTTLGREGSDFSAAIFAWCLGVKEMTIWKDVPGVMNADPKWMTDSVCLETLSYREAIELAYYGASVIHPKTIKPLENANIALTVRSFVNPDLQGTIVKKMGKWKIKTPVFIRKQNQVLISISPRDFSFILEGNLSEIFRILASFRVKVNVMQNSAISFSICVDADPLKINPLIAYLKKDYETRYNAGLELFTIRHYNNESVDRIIQDRKIMMELRSRNTVQLVLSGTGQGNRVTG